MTIAFFIIAAVVSMPILAVVLVTMASRREESAWSLHRPAQGVMQAAARRIVGFHGEDPGWPLPKNHGQGKAGTPALRSVGQPSRSTAADSPRRVATSNVRVAA